MQMEDEDGVLGRAVTTAVRSSVRSAPWPLSVIAAFPTRGMGRWWVTGDVVFARRRSVKSETYFCTSSVDDSDAGMPILGVDLRKKSLILVS